MSLPLQYAFPCQLFLVTINNLVKIFSVTKAHYKPGHPWHVARRSRSWRLIETSSQCRACSLRVVSQINIGPPYALFICFFGVLTFIYCTALFLWVFLSMPNLRDSCTRGRRRSTCCKLFTSLISMCWLLSFTVLYAVYCPTCLSTFSAFWPLVGLLRSR